MLLLLPMRAVSLRRRHRHHRRLAGGRAMTAVVQKKLHSLHRRRQGRLGPAGLPPPPAPLRRLLTQPHPHFLRPARLLRQRQRRWRLMSSSMRSEAACSSF